MRKHEAAAVSRSSANQEDTTTTESDELLLERAVGERRAPSVSEATSLLRPQQHRNVVWRWHVRRRSRRK